MPATWDLVLVPQSHWFDLRLHELWRCRDLIVLFVRRDLVAQFKQTVLGPAWLVAQPLLTTITFAIVFGNIARLDTDGLPKLPFYLAGSILWLFFANCLTSTGDTFRANAGLFGKVYFPRLVVPISIVLSHGLRLAIQIVLFLAVWVGYRALGVQLRMTWAALLLPALVAMLAVLGLACGILVSAAASKYRDIQYLVQLGVQLAMYTTTVIYPLAAIRGGRWRYFILANPLTPILEAFRFGFLGTGSFDWGYLAYSAACAAVLLLAGLLVFARVERTFMDTV